MTKPYFNVGKLKTSRILAILILVLVLFACADTDTAVVTDGIIQTIPDQGTADTGSDYIFATSSQGFARIEGRLVVTDPLIVLPLPDGVYLLPVKAEVQTEGEVAKLSLDDAIQADVDERDGRFVFPNVDAGRYAVVVQTTSTLVVSTHVSGSGELVIIEIGKADIDDVVDIGRIRVP